MLLGQKTLETINGIGNFVPVEAGGAAGKTAANQIDELFSVIITFLTIVAGLSFLIYFIIGALNWITAGGDEKKIDSAKSYMTNGAIGLIIIVASYSIIWIAGQVLGIDILNPGITIDKLFNKPVNII